MTTASAPQLHLAAADEVLGSMWQDRLQPVGGLPFVGRTPRQAAADLVAAAAAPGRTLGEHVHLANAYSIALADTRAAVVDAFRAPGGWVLPDGRPLTWISALRRDRPRLEQVRGPQLLLDVADLGRAAGLRHYLLGGSPRVLRDMQARLSAAYPGIRIVGASSPPFRAPTEEELRRRDAEIRASGAQIVWVGLGTPKQDFEAVRLAESLPVVSVAVGAAFDYAAGALKTAPHWISVIGFEWLWRFAAEPRRLWKRYTVGNVQFLRATVRDEVGRRCPTSRRDRTAVLGQLPPPLHGSAVMTERLVEALRSLGSTVTVVDRRFSRSVAEVGRPALRKLGAIPSLLARFVRATARADRLVLLITTSPASFLIDRALLAVSRRPVVLYVHTVGFRALADRGRLWTRLVRGAFARAERVVVLGPTLTADVAPFVDAARIAVVPNCTPPVAAVRHGAGRRVLFLANLLPGKGADVFVRLARELVAHRVDPSWRFDLAGAGDAEALGPLPEQLTVHGAVIGEAKAALLRDADVLVVPSTYAMEAQPLVIVEALSYGLPVVAYDSGGIRDLVDDSVGALVTPGDEEALADAVLDLLDSPERLAAARRNALARYERHHSPGAYAAAWRDLLHDDGPRGPGADRAA